MANPKLQVAGLYKIFGPSPGRALELQRDGASKDEIQRRTGDVIAVSDVSFTVQAGQFFVVMGLSGSGKSTLVRCINRLIEPTSGEVEIDGGNVTRMDGENLRQLRLGKMAMVFQHFALFPHRTVGQNVEYGLKIQGVDADERRERALEALDLVGLRSWADRSPEDLSGGMRQRVGLARALAVDPEILLMDEPFSALDPLIRRDMQDELLTLQQRFHKTIVFITHDLHEALKLGDQVAIMKEGRFVQVGDPETIVASPADPYVAAFTQDVDRGRVLSIETVMRDAETVTAERDDVETASRLLHKTRRAGLFVLDHDGKPIGVVGHHELSAAADGNGRSAGLLSAMQRQFPTADPDTKLADVYELCTGGLPIAVLDDSGRLIGAVEPLELFAQLEAKASAPERSETDVSQDAPSYPDLTRAAQG